MDMLTNDEINNIRNSVDIVDVISKYIPLTQKGKNYFGICPFHDDHSPSMSVSKEKQIYTCFTCGATGNVFKFIMDYENISFKESIKTIASIAGIKVNLGNIKEKILPNKELYDIYETSVKFYQNNINTINGKKAKEYLNSREINEDIIKEFQIGLSLKENDLLTKLLINKDYKKENLLKSGLIIKNDTGYVDIYYNRIMFPLTDIQGRVVGYSGRVYNGEKDSKYINTKETDIFKKGELLYNYYRAKDECRNKNQVIIVEGFMDVIRLYTVGITNVVATMGTAITKNHANLIRRMANEIILCFDGDKAGEKATVSCIEELGNLGIIPKVIRLEEDLDPDDYIRKYGKDKFLSKLSHPMNIMDFKLSYLKKGKDFDNNIELANYINGVIEEVNKIDDSILKEVTLKKLSEETKIDMDLLKSKLVIKKEPIKKPLENKRILKYEKAQMCLIFYMLRSTEVIKTYNRKMTFMPTEEYRKLAREISYFYKNNSCFNLADFITYLSLENINMLTTLGNIEKLELKDEYVKEEIDDYINAIMEYNIKTECSNLHDEIKEKKDLNLQTQLLQKLIDLRNDGGKV